MKKLIILLVFAGIISCDIDDGRVDDCSNVLCVADVSSLHFEIIERNSQENVFLNGRYQSEDVAVTDGTGKAIPFAIAAVFTDDIATLILLDPAWKIGTFNYRITLGEDIDFEVATELERDNLTGCCSNRLFVKEVGISGISHELQDNPQIATILLD